MSISFEDASDDLGFLVEDDALSLGVRVDLVTVAERSCTQPRDDLARQAPLGLRLQVFEKGLRHRAQEADHDHPNGHPDAR